MGLILPKGVTIRANKDPLYIATEEDISTVLKLAMSFAKATGYKELITEERVEALIKTLVTSDNNSTIVLLWKDVGVLAGAKAPFLYGPHLTATELFWWVEPDYRKLGVGEQLLNAFEFWAEKVGCDLITMVGLDNKLDKYYNKKGYKLYERAYMKKLNGSS